MTRAEAALPDAARTPGCARAWDPPVSAGPRHPPGVCPRPAPRLPAPLQPRGASGRSGRRTDFDRIPMNASVKQDTRRVLDLTTPKPAPYGYGTLALIRNPAGHLLMHRRDNNPGICWPDTWSPLGGKPEAEDTGPAATIRREVCEEVGLQVPLEHLLTHTADSGHLTYPGEWDGASDSLVLSPDRRRRARVRRPPGHARAADEPAGPVRRPQRALSRPSGPGPRTASAAWSLQASSSTTTPSCS